MKNPNALELTRGQFLIGGVYLLGGGLLSQILQNSTLKKVESSVAVVPIKDRIPLKELLLEEAKEKLLFWNETARKSIRFRKGEPALSLILALLIFKHKHEGIELDGFKRNPLHEEMHAFFTQIRIRRILEAVASGEAGEDVHEIIQSELNKTGGFGPIWAQMPLFLHRQAYLKIRILESFELETLRLTSTGRNWAEFPINIFSSGKFVLDEILILPLRDPFHEREYEFA